MMRKEHPNEVVPSEVLPSEVLPDQSLSTQALPSSDVALESLLDQSDDGILIHDSNRVISYANSRIAEVANKPLNEIVGKDCFDIFPGVLCGVSCLFCQDEPGRRAERSVAQPGLEVRATPFRGPLGDLAGALIRVRSGSAVSEDSTELVDAFGESAAFLTSLDTSALLDVNEAACRRSGYTKTELLSAMSTSTCLGADPHFNMSQMLREGYSDYRSVFSHKDGRELQTEVVSFLMRLGGESAVLSLTLEPTDRKLTEDALHRSVNNLHSLLELLPIGVVVYDTKGIEFVNPAFVRFLGHPEHLVGQSLRRFVSDTCSGKIRDETHELDGTIESIQFICRDGSTRNAEVTTLPIEFDDRWMCVAIVRDMSQIVELRRSLGRERNFRGLIGQHPEIRNIWGTIKDVARSQVPVLIAGETGTGKELVAKAVHLESDRAEGPLIAVNCGALPDGLLESELFGHVRGAFTGAYRDKRGLFELAHGGTIFLDEVGELSLATQVKLLRVLQERRVQPVGSEQEVDVNVRVLSATNRDLRDLIHKSMFREDLYFRLCVVPISLPPLRARGTDVILIAQHLLQKFSAEAKRPVPTLSDGCKQRLLSWSWPGNVRELANAVQHALVMARGEFVQIEHLPKEIRETPESPIAKVGRSRKLTVEQVKAALAEAGGNKAKAARLLGVGRSTIYRYDV